MLGAGLRIWPEGKPVGQDQQIMSEEKTALNFGRKVLATEAKAVAGLAERLSEEFTQAVQMVYDCKGAVILTGMGKAGIVAQKISATLASTGTLSYFLHPADALHGDLGRVQEADLVLVLSYGGETEEISRLLDIVAKIGAKIIGMTARESSTLARKADIALLLGELSEACPLGLAPTTSTTCMLALGDALAMAVMKMRNFAEQDYARFHPGGSLGRRLSRVDDLMSFHEGRNLPVANDSMSVRQALAAVTHLSKRSGAILLVDQSGKLTGIFTDADLRRLLEKGLESVLDEPVATVMTRDPKRIRSGTQSWEAARIFEEYRVDELPVVNESDEPVGLIDVQDLVVHKVI